MYLFGASPALSSDFLRGRAHDLQSLSDDTLYLPYATSLRMSDFGYQNKAQAGIVPPYNSLQAYVTSLVRALEQSHAPYEKFGTRRNDEWLQINTNLLQIENEYYATIRPKRIIGPGERPLEALHARGIQYVEVRCLDIDPFNPLGIGIETARFLDAFLLFCALDESPLTDDAQARENAGNFARAVKEGRRPGLVLQCGGADVGLRAWGLELLDRIAAVADALDAQRGDNTHAQVLAMQRAKLESPELTPSAKALDAVRAQGGSFLAFGLQQSHAHAQAFRARPLSAEERAYFTAMARKSLAEQARIESMQTGTFDSFIAAYQARLPRLSRETGGAR
jgi:glutamate--cysteine ligase